MKANAVIVLEALLSGLPVKLGGCEYWMSEEFDLCIKRTEYSSMEDMEKGKGKDVFLKADIEIGYFIRMCNKLTHEEVFLIGASKVLRENNMGSIK